MNKQLSPLVKLAIPLTLTGLVQSGNWFFVNIFLAHVSEDALAAGALVGWLFATVVVIIFGTLSSINILVAYKHGANDAEGIKPVARDGIRLAVLLSLPFIILFWYMAPIFHYLGQPESVVVAARGYLHGLSYGILANFIALACLEVIIGLGHARVIFIFSVIETTLNATCSYIFIFGKLGLPKLGVAGAGWGMTVCFVIKLSLLLIYIASRKDYRAYFSKVFTLEKSQYLIEMIQLGLPMGLMYCVEVAFFLTLTIAVGALSTIALAANQVAMLFVGLTMNMAFAFAQAITVRMGHLLGAHDVASAKEAGRVGAMIPMLSMCFIAIIYWMYPQFLVNLAFDVNNPANAAIVSACVKLLALAALFQIIESGRIALFGALRALKETRFTFLVSIIGFWCVALPIGYMLAAKFKLGPTGYWWGMIFGATISILLLRHRFQQKFREYLNIAMLQLKHD